MSEAAHPQPGLPRPTDEAGSPLAWLRERSRGRLLAVVLVALFALPLAAVVIRAFADAWRAPALVPQELGTRGFDVAFGAADAIFLSLAVAALTTALCLALAWPAARVLGLRRLPRNGLVALAIAMSLLMPQYLAGFGLTEWFIRLGLDGTLVGLVAVHVLFSLPYAILILLSGFTAEVTSLEEMAASAGADRLQRLRWVTLPSLAPALAAAGLLSFLASWSQYGSSLAVGGGRSTLPIVMLPFVRNDPQVAAAFAIVFIVPAVLALLVAARSQRAPL